ncbi:hypothetical protein ACHAXR_002215 [Thalassiosira sp. AJA248-18]
MNAVRTIALMAYITSWNVRHLTRLMATAFTPPRHAVTKRFGSHSGKVVSSLHFYSTLSTYQHSFAGSSFVKPISCAHVVQPPCAFTKLYSTTPTNDIIATDDNIVEVDPYSDEARDDLANFYEQNGIETDDIDATHDLLLRLTEQVLSWNKRLNLVSRKDCTASVIYHRHVLPSVALLPLILENNNDENNPPSSLNIVDVGTGGGFPGLPLALLLPDVQFTLVDSVQKKLKAVAEMAAELEMTNVRVHWGRVEEMYEGDKGRREHRGRYDIVLGRSVTALPRFCGWVSDLLKGNNVSNTNRGDAGADEQQQGRLIYIIGGELEDIVESRIVQDIALDQLLQRAQGTSDKRALIFHARDVEEIANESGEKQKIVRSGPVKTKNKNNNNGNRGGKKLAKGAWSKKQNDVKKQRGYDDFQRYES